MFKVKCTYKQGWLRVTTSGELDLQSAPIFQTRLREAVKQHQAYRIVLDFADLTFIDSAGIGAILSSYRYITGLKGEMRLGPVASRIRPGMQLSGLERIMLPASVSRRRGQRREKDA